jgi:hypothetical protein
MNRSCKGAPPALACFGVRSGETCDRQHRDPEERWQVGTIEMETGKLIEPAAPLAEADGGAPDEVSAVSR